jgi:predicted house-cleaning noncanonical NTP pyrophosphatase (MazG superfamily)
VVESSLCKNDTFISGFLQILVAGEKDMSQSRVEETISEIERINEVLKDSKIGELCDILDAYGRALRALVEKRPDRFDIMFIAHADRSYTVKLFVGNEEISYMSVNGNTTINDMFERIFSSQEIKDKVVTMIHKTLAEIAIEIAEKADLVRRVKEIEEKLKEEDPDC